MKYIFLIMITLSQLLTASQNLEWLSYKEVFELSEDRLINKPVLVFVGSTNCTFCKKEKEDINKNENFKNFLNNEYIYVYINQEKDFTPVDLYSEMVPAFYILSPKTLKPLVSKPAFGAIPLKNLQIWLEEISDKYKNFNKGR